jgi:hypothetical protein
MVRAVRAFLEGTMRGEWAALRQLAAEAGLSRPEFTVRLFGKLWP